ncbi:MAG TPA: hypothetical protein VKZ53_10005 [Candidatus Angelobacter sp.]|nr:hypothetical protein [Candidatus Angelobacter sp.]
MQVKRMLAERTYHPGEQVPQTGLYRVFHYQHRMPHDVLIDQGRSFPTCDKCGSRVAFQLSANAEPLTCDQDFDRRAA